MLLRLKSTLYTLVLASPLYYIYTVKPTSLFEIMTCILILVVLMMTFVITYSISPGSFLFSVIPFLNLKKIKYNSIDNHSYFILNEKTENYYRVFVYTTKFGLLIYKIGEFYHNTFDTKENFNSNVLKIIDSEEKIIKEKLSVHYEFNPNKFDGVITKEDARINKIDKIL